MLTQRCSARTSDVRSRAESAHGLQAILRIEKTVWRAVYPPHGSGFLYMRAVAFVVMKPSGEQAHTRRNECPYRSNRGSPRSPARYFRRPSAERSCARFSKKRKTCKVCAEGANVLAVRIWNSRFGQTDRIHSLIHQFLRKYSGSRLYSRDPECRAKAHSLRLGA